MKRSQHRQVIYQLLHGTDEGEQHLSPLQVRQALAEAGHDVALSTVYSQLDALSQAGLIGEARGLQGRRLFECNAEPHHHLLCRVCGKVRNLESLPDALSEPYLSNLKERACVLCWELLPLRLTLVGTCPACLTSSNSPSSLCT